MRIKVAAVQMKIFGDEPEKNLRSALRLAREAVGAGARFIIFPESMTSDSTPRAAEFAEPVPGPTTEVFQRLAREADVNFVISVNEREKKKLYNSTVLVEPGGIAGVYRKTHLWEDEDDLEGFGEKEVFSPGDEIAVFNFGGIRAGVMVCWDGQYPEIPRVLALAGAEVIFYPNNRSGMELAYLAALAERNVVPIIAVNRVGLREIFPPDRERTKRLLSVPVEERKGRFFYRCRGETTIFDETGKTLAGVRDVEKVITAEIDTGRVRELRERKQYFRCRRPELYGLISRTGRGFRSGSRGRAKRPGRQKRI